MGAFSHLITDTNRDGFFDPVTSSIDWCEINYTVSYYIAEFLNTISNLPGLFAGLWGAYTTYRSGVPCRYALVYLGLALINIGSFGFHASLKWEWQLMDELPMIYVVSYTAYLVLDTLPGMKARFGILGPLVLLVWDIFVSVSYVCLPNPVYHQVAFASIMFFCIGRSIWLAYQIPRERRSKIGRTLLTGITVFATGFAIWNVDNYFCTSLRRTRDWFTANGLHHLGHFTQGHAYWHFMTSYGSMLIFTASIELCLSVKTSPNMYDYDSSAWFPLVYPVKSDVKAEDTTNGVAARKSEKANGNGAAKHVKN